MVNNISIAIIGLSLSTTNQVKSLIKTAINNKYIINWTNIADKQLNLLIIGKNFTDSPAIQKVFNKNLKTLIIETNSTISNCIIDQHLYMPFDAYDTLKNWLVQNIFDSTEPIVLQPNSSNTQINLSQLHTALAQDSEQYFLCTINNLQQFIVDKKQQEIWVPADFKIDQINQLSIHPLIFNEVINYRSQKIKYDLTLWLWNFLWDNIQNIPHLQNQYYKLTSWPQPLTSQAKDCLKLAACFQYGAECQYVHQYTKIDISFIQKFIYVSYISNILIESTEELSKFKLDYEPQSQIKSFFSKLRKKLRI